jgi:hypothetical protein
MSKFVTPEDLLNSQVEEFNKGNIGFYYFIVKEATSLFQIVP